METPFQKTDNQPWPPTGGENKTSSGGENKASSSRGENKTSSGGENKTSSSGGENKASSGGENKTSSGGENKASGGENKASAGGRPTPSPPDPLSPRALSLQMPRVGPGLYLSGLGGATSRRVLEARGITHVLCLARELADVQFPDGGALRRIQVRRESLRDSEEEDLLSRLPELVEHIRGVVEGDGGVGGGGGGGGGGGRIVVCCVAGVSRSASVVLAYKVSHEGVTLREAFDQVHEARPVVSPNPRFWRDLVEWEIAVRGGESSVVMLPYVCGMVPELESYQQYTVTRVRLAWMRELVAMWTVHLLILTLQALAIVWW